MNEKTVRKMVAEFLQLQYPGVIYRFDLAADLKLTVGQASQHKRLHPMRGFPDLFIFAPVGNFCGLAIELKKEGARIKKRNGDWASEHLREQAEVLDRLNELGYFATFAVGFEDAMDIINDYLDSAGQKGKRRVKGGKD